MRTTLISAKQQWEVDLKPKLEKDAQRSSTYQMLLRYMEMGNYVLGLNGIKIETFLLNPVMEKNGQSDDKTLGLRRCDEEATTSRRYNPRGLCVLRYCLRRSPYGFGLIGD